MNFNQVGGLMTGWFALRQSRVAQQAALLDGPAS